MEDDAFMVDFSFRAAVQGRRIQLQASKATEMNREEMNRDREEMNREEMNRDTRVVRPIPL